MDSRKCTKCGEVKLLTEFNKDRFGKFGRCSSCKVCRAAYRKANRENIAEYNKRYNVANAERNSEYHRKYREENAARISAREKEYRNNNKAAISIRKAKHRCDKTDRTPVWACEDTIGLYYETRKALSDATGIVYHVDHIYPLRGATVSGLHVPGNLQIITKKSNLSKNASQVIDY